MQLIINGQPRAMDELGQGSTVAGLVAALGMQADRVALERNGEIVARASWGETPVVAGDRFEIVHFVGGGAAALAGGSAAPQRSPGNNHSTVHAQCLPNGDPSLR